MERLRLNSMRRFINMYEPLTEEFIEKNPQNADRLRRLLEQKREHEKHQFKPEPKTLNWWAEQKETFIKKPVTGCYTSQPFQLQTKYVRDGALKYLDFCREIIERDLNSGKRYF